MHVSLTACVAHSISHFVVVNALNWQLMTTPSKDMHDMPMAQEGKQLHLLQGVKGCACSP
jgi:hypothetical protein